MRRHHRFGILCAVFGLLAVLTGCFSDNGRRGGSVRAPVLPPPPTPRDYPEFSAASPHYARQPLPPLAPAVTTHGQTGLQPVSVEVAAPGRKPVRVRPGFDNDQGLQAMKQLIYGGDHPEFRDPGPYRFHVGDQLALTVKGHPEFSGDLKVVQEGTIRIPNTDDFVQVISQNRKEVEKAVAQRIAPYIKGEPEVRVHIRFGRGGFYYMFGEVKRPGRFPMGLRPIRLSEAIFRANSSSLGEDERSSRTALRDEVMTTARSNFGLSQYAYLPAVNVITPHRSRPSRKSYNVKKALLQGITGEDPYVQPGQIIFVPSTFDKRIIDFSRRVIAPLQAISDLEGEANYWYQRTTGNRISENAPNRDGTTDN